MICFSEGNINRTTEQASKEHRGRGTERVVNSCTKLRVSGGTYIFHTKSLLASRRNLTSIVWVEYFQERSVVTTVCGITRGIGRWIAEWMGNVASRPAV